MLGNERFAQKIAAMVGLRAWKGSFGRLRKREDDEGQWQLRVWEKKTGRKTWSVPIYSLGLSYVTIGNTARRDRMLLMSAMATLLLTLLGAASESLGMDRLLKANASKKGTHSLFRQGCMWYQLIPNMPKDRLRPLMREFGKLVRQQPAFRAVFEVV